MKEKSPARLGGMVGQQVVVFLLTLVVFVPAGFTLVLVVFLVVHFVRYRHADVREKRDHNGGRRLCAGLRARISRRDSPAIPLFFSHSRDGRLS